jgi:hypothetical protein
MKMDTKTAISIIETFFDDVESGRACVEDYKDELSQIVNLLCKLNHTTKKDTSFNVNLEGSDHFIHALIMNQKIWPNPYGQNVAAAAFVVHEERLQAQQEINRLQEEIRQLREALKPTHWIPLSPYPETKEIAMNETITQTR